MGRKTNFQELTTQMATHDPIQHGIDDDPNNDATKGGIGGAVGGAVVGGLAGGPLGAVVGAVAGGVASAAGVAAVDKVDNDNTVTGIGHGATRDVGDQVRDATHGDRTPGNDVPGVQTGGVTTAGADSRGLTEKAADAITGDRTDDKTGGRVI